MNELFKNFNYKGKIRFNTTDSSYNKALQIIDDKRAGKYHCFKTGWNNLNNMLGGGIPIATTVTIAARPSVGKSTISNLIAFDVFDINKDKQILVLYWTWEMPSEQQILRIISNKLGISIIDLIGYSKEIDNDLYSKIKTLEEELKSKNILFFEVPSSPRDMLDFFIFVSEKYKDYYIINFFDHTRLVGKDKDSIEEVKIYQFMSMCNYINKAYKMTNIVLSQLNRKVEEDLQRGTYRRPGLSDIFGSDSVSQFSNIVITLHRPDMNNIPTIEISKNKEGKSERIYTDNKIFLEIVKNRDGGLGTVILNYFKETNQIIDYEHE